MDPGNCSSRTAEHKRNELSKSVVSSLLTIMELGPQSPIHRSYQQNLQKLNKYLTKCFPEFRVLLKRTAAQILPRHGAAVSSDAHRGMTWGRILQAPVVADSDCRMRLHLMSGVNPRGDMNSSRLDDAINKDHFVGLVRKLPEGVYAH